MTRALAIGAACLFSEVVIAFRQTQVSEVSHMALDSSVMLWNIYESSGPKMSDIRQGRLGDCYFMAGIAAVAQVRPDVIKEVFVTKGKVNSIGRSVYQLRFLLDGEEKIVAVDDMVPMMDTGANPFIFAGFHDGDNAWPVLMEKGFAKLFGSYLRIRAGIEYEAFKAVTQAPVDVFDILDGMSDQTILDWISESVSKKWPMTGGTVKNFHGVTSEHAFVIMEHGLKQTDGGKKQAVHIYNPWSHNKYSGSLATSETQKTGDYWLTLSEFRDSFQSLQRARILPKAHLTTLRVPVGPAALTFSTKTGKPFYVQLEYPSSKILPSDCKIDPAKSNAALRVAPTSDFSKVVAGKKPWHHVAVSNLRADMPGAAGEYVIVAASDFGEMTAIDHVIINIYSEEPIDDLHFSKKLTAVDVLEKMYGLCDDFAWKGHFRFQRSKKTLMGSPSWVAVLPNNLQNPPKTPILFLAGEKGLQMASDSSATNVYADWKLECITDELKRYNDCKSVTWQGRQFKRAEDYMGGAKWVHKGHQEFWLRYLPSSGWKITPPVAEGKPDNIQATYPMDKMAECVKSESSLLDEEAEAHTDEPIMLETVTSDSLAEFSSIQFSEHHANNSLNLQACNQQDVAKRLERYRDLNNYDDLLNGKEDALFPPAMKSIGEEGADCDDSATGRASLCEQLNHWGSITKRLQTPDHVPEENDKGQQSLQVRVQSPEVNFNNDGESKGDKKESSQKGGTVRVASTTVFFTLIVLGLLWNF